MSSWSMEKILIFNLNLNTLQVLDNATTHKTSKVKDKINECETALSGIPSALTWRIQLLDIYINKMFE